MILRRHLFRQADRRPVADPPELVRVRTEDDLVSDLARDRPEVHVRVVPSLDEALQVDLERNVQLFRAPCEAAHMLFKQSGISDEMNDVGVREAVEVSRLQAFDALVDVAGQLPLVVRLPERGVVLRPVLADLVAQVVLPEQEVLERVLGEELHQPAEVFRVVLDLQTQVDPNVGGIFLFQCEDGVDVGVHLLRAHLDARGIVVPVVKIWRVIRKTENRESSADRLLDVLARGSRRVPAQRRVVMVTRVHMARSFRMV